MNYNTPKTPRPFDLKGCQQIVRLAVSEGKIIEELGDYLLELLQELVVIPIFGSGPVYPLKKFLKLKRDSLGYESLGHICDTYVYRLSEEFQKDIRSVQLDITYVEYPFWYLNETLIDLLNNEYTLVNKNCGRLAFSINSEYAYDSIELGNYDPDDVSLITRVSGCGYYEKELITPESDKLILEMVIDLAYKKGSKCILEHFQTYFSPELTVDYFRKISYNNPIQIF